MKVNHGYQHFCKEPPAVSQHVEHSRGVLQYGLPLHTVQVHVTRVIDLLPPRLENKVRHIFAGSASKKYAMPS